MKLALVVFASIFTTFSAQAAAVQCVNHFGTVVRAELKGPKLELNFSHPAYKKSSGKFNGEYRGLMYFRKGPGELVAMVDRSVFETGNGRVLYMKKGGNKGYTQITFRCGNQKLEESF